MDDDFQTTLAAYVARAQTMARVPSLTFAVGIDGVPFAVASSGYADVEQRVAASSESCYRIGSITKTFTAAIALMLAHHGEIGLDDTIDRYLRGTPFGHVPLRMLLSHNSGLQREAPLDMWETMQGPSAAELRKSFRDAELVANPGQRWHYSNLGYAVLGQIVEQVCGQSCESLIEQKLLAPLELTRTSWGPPPDAVTGYRLDPFIDTVHREPVMDQAAIGVGGQMWSTPGDLLRWGHALAGGEPAILPVPIVEDMHTLQVMVDTTRWTRGWGLGLILERRGERILAGHTGAMPGFQSALSIDRSSGIVVVALANATRGIALADLASEVLLDAIASRPPEAAEEWRPAAACPDEIEPILGSWWSEADETILRWARDGLHAHLVSQPETSDTRLVAEGPGRFRAVEGRLQGELLIVTAGRDGVEIRWATYPLTRTPR